MKKTIRTIVFLICCALPACAAKNPVSLEMPHPLPPSITVPDPLPEPIPPQTHIAGMLDLNNAWTGNETHSGTETFSNGVNTNALTVSGISGLTQCVHANSSGVFSGAGADCSTGGGGPFSGPNPWIDITTFGARGLTVPFNTITVTTSSSSPTVTTTGISDFQNKDGIVIPQAGSTTTQSTPSAPTITAIGASGSATISYKCVGVDVHYGLTAASAAGSTFTAPSVFGWAAVKISSISRNTNVVTVNASSAFPVSSGNYHAVIANVTGGSTQFSGLQYVTVTSGTTLTYSQTGANESGSVVSNSFILFENAFVITTVQATAGSNQLVLTTDVNHNIVYPGSTPNQTRPTKIFLDGIYFSGANPPGYANGLFGVAAVGTNTITITTQYTSPVTTTASTNINYSTSGVAQMTATVIPLVDVTCPAISSPTKYYAIYADYGSGYSPVGFTPWTTNIFEDYGPAYTKTGFVAPPAMNLPATPPTLAQNQAFTGQILSISGSTLTLTTSVPTAVTGVTAHHDNGSALLSALALSCSDGGGGTYNHQGYAPVYLPRQALSGATIWYYLFSAPVDLSINCTKINVLDGNPIWANGTIYADGANGFSWQPPPNAAGFDNFYNDIGGYTTITGYASTIMVPGNNNAFIQNMGFNTLSSGQVGLVYNGSDSQFKNTLWTTHDTPGLTEVPFLAHNSSFALKFENTAWSGNRDVQYPIAESSTNFELGLVTWWPVPVFDVQGPILPDIEFGGINYGNGRAFQMDNLYGNVNIAPYLKFSDVVTNQGPWQPFLQFYGTSGGRTQRLNISRVQQDSIQMPVVSCATSDVCIILYEAEAALTSSDGAYPSFTGTASSNAIETLTHGAAPAQNTNETAFGQRSVQIPSVTATGTGAALSGTGACSTITTQFGGAWAGEFKCTGTTGASTITITPGPTAPNHWGCGGGSDVTAGTAMPQSGSLSATTCTISGTVNTNDVITFSAVSY